MKKFYFTILLAAFTLTTVYAQDNTNLNKEITLEKDIEPLQKKAVKKNQLPKVKTLQSTQPKTNLGYSDLMTPIEVPTDIPTLLPYGYRTAHNFSNKRGYLDVGGGSQANFRLDFGYRIIDQEREKLGVWLNHNSTWDGRNSSKLITNLQNRAKQKFNDNTLGVDYSKAIGNGTLSLGFKGHMDNYNYYGGWKVDDRVYTLQPEMSIQPYCNWEKEKQTFYDFTVNAGWNGRLKLHDRPLQYGASVLYGHAAYDKSFSDLYKKGVHDNWGIITLTGNYGINDLMSAGLMVKGEYLNRGTKARSYMVDDLKDEVGLITVSPTFTVLGDMYKLQLGLNGHFSMSDGPTVRISPNVRFNLALVDGFTVFANALGGKYLGYRVPTHFANHRYDSPLLMYGSIFTPLDAEAGIKIGPFQGLSAKVSLGYAIVKDQPGICYRTDYADHALMAGMMSTYHVLDGRGYYINAEVAYKYRSLLEAKAAVKYAPHDNELFVIDKHYNGYKLGVDRASTVANIDLKVTPWKPLSVNVGLDYRGGRMALFKLNDEYNFVDMDDAIDLHAGLSYRVTNRFTLWTQAHNLLNRRYDILYGMGAQRIGVMAGLSLTF